MKKMEEIRWWHQVPLGDGRVTPGLARCREIEPDFCFQELDFRGKSVLDIGAWDGYYSFMAEQRGASRVVALDDLSCRWGGLDGFEFLHAHFKSKVEWKAGNVYRLPDERFDIVLCYGVLYHLSDPLLALLNCFPVAKERIAFEGLFQENPKPILSLLPRHYSNDCSNIWVPSSGFVIEVASQCGFALTRKHLPGGARGTMIFDRFAEAEPEYCGLCFPCPTKYGNEICK